MYKHTLLVQTHPTVTTMPYGDSLGNGAKLCSMTAHSDPLTETYMQTAGEMMNLRVSVDLRVSKPGRRECLRDGEGGGAGREGQG